MIHRTLKTTALTLALTMCLPQRSVASEPPTSPTPRRELVAGSALIGLGFAAELSGTIISLTCAPTQWCSRGLALTLGEPTGPSRYIFVSAGRSSAYIGGRLAALPLLTSGFTLLMVGVAARHTDAVGRHRGLGWGLFGTGIGVLAASRVLRAVFLVTGTCQAASCTHGFDQASLWVGRSLAFAGGGLLVRGRGHAVTVTLGGGPASSHGLSVAGRF